MIIPARWFAGGRGLEIFRNNMLHDKRIRKLVDYPISSECFSGVEIKGGICYLLWTRDTEGTCSVTTIRNSIHNTMERYLLEDSSDTFIRYNESIDIFHKVLNLKEKSFSGLVSSLKPFGLRTYVTGNKGKKSSSITLFANKNVGYIEPSEILINKDWINRYKVFISRAYGAGEDFPHQILGVPIFGDKNPCCTETYLVIGPFDTENICKNVISYIKTRFLRFLVLLKKSTQNATKQVYSFVPMQDFTSASDIDWSRSVPQIDEQLYAKYGLSSEEVAFIESMIRPME